MLMYPSRGSRELGALREEPSRHHELYVTKSMNAGEKKSISQSEQMECCSAPPVKRSLSLSTGKVQGRGQQK